MSIINTMLYNGYRLVVSSLLEIDYEKPIFRKCTWRERIYQRPLWPFGYVKQLLIGYEQQQGIFQVGNSLYMSPSVFKKLKESLDSAEKK